jgi:hypothetical protein
MTTRTHEDIDRTQTEILQLTAQRDQALAERSRADKIQRSVSKVIAQKEALLLTLFRQVTTERNTPPIGTNNKTKTKPKNPKETEPSIAERSRMADEDDAEKRSSADIPY